MSKRLPKLYLEDIVNSIDNIEKYIEKLLLEDLEKDQKTFDAVVRNIEIIGEAAKNLPEEYKEKNSEIPWNEIVAMRNKVIHEYFGVSMSVLWQTIKVDLPKLKKQIEKLLKLQ